MTKRQRKLEKITSRWQKTDRIMDVSINGKIVKKKVPVLVRKIRGKYQIRRVEPRRRGPKPRVKASTIQPPSTKWT